MRVIKPYSIPLFFWGVFFSSLLISFFSPSSFLHKSTKVFLFAPSFCLFFWFVFYLLNFHSSVKSSFHLLFLISKAKSSFFFLLLFLLSFLFKNSFSKTHKSTIFFFIRLKNGFRIYHFEEKSEMKKKERIERKKRINRIIRFRDFDYLSFFFLFFYFF